MPEFDVEDLSLSIVQAYGNAEEALIRYITNRLVYDIDSNVTNPVWAANKLGEVSQVRTHAQVIANNLSRGLGPELREVVEEAYRRGDIAAVDSLVGQNLSRVTGINRQAVTALVRDTQARLGSTHFAIVRQTNDVYSNTVAAASSQSVIGVETRRRVTQQILNQFASQGVTGFVDRANRSWNLTSYAEMATRTVTMRSAVQGHSDRLMNSGHDLVIVSAHWDSCDMCDPWEGEILSQSGNNPDYYSLDDAVSTGLFHPNCLHSLGAYIEGATRELEPPAGMDFEQRRAEYDARQEQRYNERKIREWKRREAAAFEPNDVVRTQAKVAEWQSKQASHLDEWGFRRKPERESITQVR